MEGDISIKEVLSGKRCPYCNCATELVSDKEIYGPNYTYGGKYYRKPLVNPVL